MRSIHVHVASRFKSFFNARNKGICTVWVKDTMYSLTDNYMNEHNACDFTLITLSCTH